MPRIIPGESILQLQYEPIIGSVELIFSLATGPQVDRRHSHHMLIFLH
jgi:hypothetical protein